MTKTIIIVNPIAGGKDKTPIINYIKKELSSRMDLRIIYWEKPEQKDDIIQEIRNSDCELVMAIGGDGTINQVASAIVGTNKKLGIIPVGSGNGLARHLQIPLNIEKAVEVINQGKTKKIDACSVNNVLYFCTSGVGFDAHIGKLFAEAKGKRGFITYFKLTMKSFFNYQPESYRLTFNDKQITTTAFLITMANGSQYGNNAFIAPHADISDGLTNICILKPFPLYKVVPLALRFFNKTIQQSKYMESYTASQLTITRNNAGPIHYDGEPLIAGTEIQYKVLPSSLNVIVP